MTEFYEKNRLKIGGYVDREDKEKYNNFRIF